MTATGKGTVVIGRIGRPHGVRGELRVVPTGPTMASVRPGESVTVASSEGRSRAAVVEAIRPVARGVLVRLRGVATREDAAALTGWTVSVPADRLGGLSAPDEFYVRDLVGCEVFAGDVRLGVVADVHEGAANDALVVGSDDGAATLVPFTHDAVVALDVPGRQVRIRPDLLDLDAS